MPEGKIGPLDTHELIRQAFELFNRWVEDQKKYLDTALTFLNVAEKVLLAAEKFPIHLLNIGQDYRIAEAKRIVAFTRQEIQRVQKLVHAGQAAMEALSHQDPEAAIKVLDRFIENLGRQAFSAKSATIRVVSQTEADIIQALKELLQLISIAFKGQTA